MSIIKKSVTLEKIIETAVSLSDENKLTAEKFILATIMYAEENRGSKDAETVKRMLRSANVSAEKTESRIREHIKLNRVSFSDITYMIGVMDKAESDASDKGMREVTVELVLNNLLETPSARIAQLLVKDISHEIPTCIGDDTEKTDRGGTADNSNADSEPAGARIQKITEDIIKIRNALLKTVKGQYNAVSKTATGLYHAQYRDIISGERRGPKAIFLFAGSPGVGKTFLASQLEELTGLPLYRFDMSSFSDRDDMGEFSGSDSVYKGAHEGKVTGACAKTPECILLFDEIEKAHRNIIIQFLQILDAGVLHDDFTGKDVSFRDAIVIMTTNAGKQLYEQSESDDLSALSDKVIIDALKKDVDPQTGVPYFPASICSRLATGTIIMFNKMSAHVLREIAKDNLLSHTARITNATGIDIEIDDAVYTAMMLAQGGNSDARVVSSRAKMFMDSEMYEIDRLITGRGKLISGMKKVKVSVKLDSANNDIRRLFGSAGKYQALCATDRLTADRCRSMSSRCDIFTANDVADVENLIKKQDIKLALIDIFFGRESTWDYLNAEDEQSVARDILTHIRLKHPDMPVYLLCRNENELTDEELFSFLRMGVRGRVIVGDEESFNSELAEICTVLHQQESVMSLAKANKVLSFGTAQKYDEASETAEIYITDLAITAAVDAEDSANLVSELSRPEVKFDEVLGANDAKKELKFFVDYLKNPKAFADADVPMPRGILLYGPPGTGKTMLAKALASESGVSFIAVTATQFFNKYVGESEANLRKVFATARKYAPSVLFIDEVDAIARNRSGAEANLTGENVLTAFLAEMDGFISDPKRPVFVLAATNAKANTQGVLDPAFLRRFSRCILVDLPGKDDRLRYIKMRADASDIFDLSDADMESLSTRTMGMSIADLKSVCDMALKNVVIDGSRYVNAKVFGDALETFSFGEAHEPASPETLRRTAIHEAGHTLIYYNNGKKPSYVTIVSRGDFGGYMAQDDEEMHSHTKDELIAQIRVALGGRAAEIVYYGDNDGISTGPSSDLRTATNIAKHMICTYGMYERFGMAVTDPDVAMTAHDSDVRKAVNEILSQQLAETVNIIKANKNSMDRLIDELQKHDHLSGDEVLQILGDKAQ